MMHLCGMYGQCSLVLRIHIIRNESLFRFEPNVIDFIKAISPIFPMHPHRPRPDWCRIKIRCLELYNFFILQFPLLFFSRKVERTVNITPDTAFPSTTAERRLL